MQISPKKISRDKMIENHKAISVIIAQAMSFLCENEKFHPLDFQELAIDIYYFLLFGTKGLSRISENGTKIIFWRFFDDSAVLTDKLFVIALGNKINFLDYLADFELIRDKAEKTARPNEHSSKKLIELKVLKNKIEYQFTQLINT